MTVIVTVTYKTHIIACTIGLVGMYMTSYLPYRFYAKYANLLLILSFVGLLLVFVPSLGASVQGAEGADLNAGLI